MRLFPIILCCAVQAVRGYDGPPPLTEVDGRSPIRMGGELLGGYRSDYIHRGEKMGPNSVEGQISGGASLSDSWAVRYRLHSASDEERGKKRMDSRRQRCNWHY